MHTDQTRANLYAAWAAYDAAQTDADRLAWEREIMRLVNELADLVAAQAA
jgi:hypothetical protein